MTDPITPPPELVAMWIGFSARHHSKGSVDHFLDIANKAAQWGADQELEACCEVMRVNGDYVSGGVLRAIRRPKPPPTLKEQALAALEVIPKLVGFESERDAIRAALEALDD